MCPGIQGSPRKKLDYFQQIRLWRTGVWLRWQLYALVSALLVAILPCLVEPETVETLPSTSTPVATALLRHGTVATNSRLRSSPSIQGEVVGIAKQGTQVEILMEADNWFRVRSRTGLEAWIYKPLVYIDPELPRGTSAPPAWVVQPDIAELLFASPSGRQGFAESTEENSQHLPDPGAPPVEAIEAPASPPQSVAWGRLIDLMPTFMYSSGTYVIGALIVALLLSMALQMRGAKQLRRAMQEIGQILTIVEEIYINAARTPINKSGTAMPLTVDTATSQQNLSPSVEFSPAEQAVLEALSDQHAVEEGDLQKILGKKGYAGTLITGTLQEIRRKADKTECPLVQVIYAHGRYSYRLRPKVVADLGGKPLERR